MKVIYPDGGTTNGGGSGGGISYKAGDVVITNSANQPANSILATGQTVDGNLYPDLTALNNYPTVGNLSNVAEDQVLDLTTVLNDYTFEDVNFFKANGNLYMLQTVRTNNNPNYFIDLYRINGTTFTFIQTLFSTPNSSDTIYSNVAVKNDATTLIMFSTEYDVVGNTSYILFDATTETVTTSTLTLNSNIINGMLDYNNNLGKFIFISKLTNDNTPEIFTSIDGFSFVKEGELPAGSDYGNKPTDNYYNGKYYFKDNTNQKIISLDENTFTTNDEYILPARNYATDLRSDIVINMNGEMLCVASRGPSLSYPCDIVRFDGTTWSIEDIGIDIGSGVIKFLSGNTILGITTSSGNKPFVNYDFLETNNFYYLNSVDRLASNVYDVVYLNNDYLYVMDFDVNSNFANAILYTYDQSADVILPDLQPISSGDGKTNGYLIHTN